MKTKNPIITIRDLAKHLDWKDVKRAIKYHYPNDRNDYEPVFKFLQTVTKYRGKKLEKNDELILRAFYYKSAELLKHKPTAKYIVEESYYDIATKKYSLSFRPWRVVASIPIDRKTLEAYTPVDIIAHLIWEITFYGNEEEMTATAKELDKTVEKIKKNPEKYAKTKYEKQGQTENINFKK